MVIALLLNARRDLHQPNHVSAESLYFVSKAALVNTMQLRLLEL